MQTNIYLRFRGLVSVSSAVVHVLMDGCFFLSNTSLKMAEKGRNMYEACYTTILLYLTVVQLLEYTQITFIEIRACLKALEDRILLGECHFRLYYT
jgi:hypothetical protein